MCWTARKRFQKADVVLHFALIPWRWYYTTEVWCSHMNMTRGRISRESMEEEFGGSWSGIFSYNIRLKNTINNSGKKKKK